MFDPQELKQLKGAVEEVVKVEVGEVEKRLRSDLTVVVKEEVGGAEKRLGDRVSDVEKGLREEISGVEKRMVKKIEEMGDEIGTLIDEQILPQLDEKADKSDIDRIERKLDRLVDKESQNTQEISKIKSHLSMSAR